MWLSQLPLVDAVVSEPPMIYGLVVRIPPYGGYFDNGLYGPYCVCADLCDRRWWETWLHSIL